MYNVLKVEFALEINADNDQQTQRHDDTKIWPRTPILNNVAASKFFRWRCTAVHVRGFFHCLIQTTSIFAIGSSVSFNQHWFMKKEHTPSQLPASFVFIHWGINGRDNI